MDTIDETLIKMVVQHSSIKEMATMVGRSNGGVKLRLTALIKEGYILGPPKPGMARSYQITAKGIEYMHNQGYL